MRVDSWNAQQEWAEPAVLEEILAVPPAPPSLEQPEPQEPQQPQELAPLPFWAAGTPVPRSLLESLPPAPLQAPLDIAPTAVRLDAGPSSSAGAAPASGASSKYAGEPAVDPAWLAQREAAFATVRSDYEAARSLAQAQPLTASGAPGPGWAVTQAATDEAGQLPQQQPGSLVYIPSADTTPIVTSYDEGSPVYGQPAGQWLAFNEAAFASSYQAQGGAPLQALARLYDTTSAALLGAHPGLWAVATADHALNAGPPPPGRAMGDANQLGMVDLYMADPQVARLIDAFGGSASSATGGIAMEQARLYGDARYEQLSRLGNAMQSVRDQYSNAMANAAAGGSSAGWVEREVTTTRYDEGGAQQTTSMQRSFDPDAFTAWYTAQDSLASQAFRDFYGQSHTTSNGTDESGQSLGSTTTFDNPGWTIAGTGGGMTHSELVRIDPNAPPRLNNVAAVGFDLEAGWATHHSNIHQKKDWFETVVQVAAIAVVGYFTAGAASAWATTVGWGATGAAVAGGVAAGAATAAVSGVMNGNLAFKDVLRGALAGGLSGGLLQEFGGVVAQNYGAAGTVALRTTVQGGIQALLGGSFKDGAMAGFASGLASVASASLDAKIAEATRTSSMSPAEIFAAKTFSKVLGSAIRAAGSPGDPAQAFASAFLNEVVGRPTTLPSTEASSPYSLAGSGAVLGNGSSTVRLGTGDDGAALTSPSMPGTFDGPSMTDTSPPRNIGDPWNAAYGPDTQTVGWTARDGSDFATQSTGATADLTTMRRAPELDAGFGFPRPADGSVQAYVQANGSVGYLVSQGGRSEFFDPARYGVAAQADGSHDAAELRRLANYPAAPDAGMPVIELDRVVVAAPRAEVATAARASLLAGAAAGEVWTLESLTALGSRALGGLPSLGEMAAAIPELGLRALGAGAALLLTPANAGQRGIVQLNEFQRFDARPGELRGNLLELDGNDQWQTVKTGVQLVQVGNQRMALTDEQIRQLQAPLINVPPNGPPTGVPALPLPGWADRPELGTPGYPAQAPAGPTPMTTPSVEQGWRDLLTDSRSGSRLRDDTTGQFVADPNNPASPFTFSDAQRRAAWRALVLDPASPLSASERAEAEARGWRGPQRVNEFGEIETMELSHEPVPLRDGGTAVVPRWPADHASVDPFRRLRNRP